MDRKVRYQAAILRGDHLLMLKVWDHAGSGRTYWVIPGGGIEPGETEEACVRREVLEETHLDVAVERLICDLPGVENGFYARVKTYTCRVLAGEPRPGTEPEVDTEERSTITAVGWFDLSDPQSWDALLWSDPISLENIQRVRRALGYAQEA